ncbi:hypothetical protein H1Q78_00135 [Cellulosimicrobium cellulans]|uniref:hypothetical protein n=1 Tax=Cellulosimicrobium cellulans TaxID=1710 RepID=UPI001ED9EB78|nr:hypothetical protein [Cellulosimicrobium cellulans]UKJ63949.1 hypothetical protein H1Q78_00135 [Cellulosimicrobium cellulans]
MSATQTEWYSVGSFRTIRCQARPGNFEESGLHWDIQGVAFTDIDADADDSSPDLVLIGELFVHSKVECAASTVEAMLRYQNREFGQKVRIDRGLALTESQRTAGELRHVLYDTAAGIARTLAALTQSDVEIPGPTPDASVELFEPEPEETPEPAATG